MPLSDWFEHLGNLLMPALWLALLVPLVYRVLSKNSPRVPTLPAQIAIQTIALCALQLGLVVWLGRDGTLAGYALLVILAGSLQWSFGRGWRR